MGWRDWLPWPAPAPSPAITGSVSENAPVFRSLSDDERAALEAGLNLAARLANQPRPLEPKHVQSLYDECLADGVQEQEILIAVGLAFGEQITRSFDFEWVRVSDQYGNETCVAPRGKTIHCSPISMIQKRLLRGEAVNLVQLRDDTINIILKTIDAGGVGNR